MLKYVDCLCKGYDGCCVFYCDAWSCRCSNCSCMGNMSVSSCRCYMCVSWVYPVAVLNATFCMTCNLFMLVEYARGDHMEEAYFRAGLMTALWVAMSVSFCLPHPVAVSVFIICSGLCACTEMLWMCVLYLSFGYKVRHRTFGCIAMGSAVLFILRCRLLLYSAGSGVNRVQVVWIQFEIVLFSPGQTLCRYGCMYVLVHSGLCVSMWWWCHLRKPWPEPVLWVVVCLQCTCWIVLVKERHLV